jgi:hypothetical protein
LIDDPHSADHVPISRETQVIGRAWRVTWVAQGHPELHTLQPQSLTVPLDLPQQFDAVFGGVVLVQSSRVVRIPADRLGTAANGCELPLDRFDFLSHRLAPFLFRF